MTIMKDREVPRTIGDVVTLRLSEVAVLKELFQHHRRMVSASLTGSAKFNVSLQDAFWSTGPSALRQPMKVFCSLGIMSETKYFTKRSNKRISTTSNSYTYDIKRVVFCLRAAKDIGSLIGTKSNSIMAILEQVYKNGYMSYDARTRVADTLATGVASFFAQYPHYRSLFESEQVGDYTKITFTEESKLQYRALLVLSEQLKAWSKDNSAEPKVVPLQVTKKTLDKLAQEDMEKNALTAGIYRFMPASIFPRNKDQKGIVLILNEGSKKFLLKATEATTALTAYNLTKTGKIPKSTQAVLETDAPVLLFLAGTHDAKDVREELKLAGYHECNAAVVSRGPAIESSVAVYTHKGSGYFVVGTILKGSGEKPEEFLELGKTGYRRLANRDNLKRFLCLEGEFRPEEFNEQILDSYPSRVKAYSAIKRLLKDRPVHLNLGVASSKLEDPRMLIVREVGNRFDVEPTKEKALRQTKFLENYDKRYREVLAGKSTWSGGIELSKMSPAARRIYEIMLETTA